MSYNKIMKALLSGKPKHGAEPYDIVRSDGVTDSVVMPHGRDPQKYAPGIPEGVVFSVKRAGGNLHRYFMSLPGGGGYTQITAGQFSAAWNAAKNPAVE